MKKEAETKVADKADDVKKEAKKKQQDAEEEKKITDTVSAVDSVKKEAK